MRVITIIEGLLITIVEGRKYRWSLLVRRERRAFSVGVSPTRQLSFQPVAIGAATEVTKSSEPSMSKGRKATQRVGRP
jgi:hypothetical protein